MDITDRYEAEEQRRAKEEAERASDAKSEFLSRMSHELRTPLNAILGFGQLLQMSGLTGPDGEALEQMMRGGQHLLHLVDEVLDLSRAETGELRLSSGPVQTTALVHECVDLVTPLAAARRLTWQLDLPDGPATVNCDEQRLRQVLLNLLSNAIKYNREGGRISVHGEVGSGDKFLLKVRDTGEGMSPEELTRLFVPFERLKHCGGLIEGTGLGLTISRRLVEAMDGQLGVESEVGTGSTFWIELPLEHPEPAAPEFAAMLPSLPAGTVSTHSELFYIEDNPANLQVVTMLLARYRPGWHLRTASDGIQGLAGLREHLPDLVLLDLQLPGLSGDQVLKQLRQDPRTSRLPVVILSADASARSRAKLLDLGANDYLPKPFAVNRLLELLDRHALEPASVE